MGRKGLKLRAVYLLEVLGKNSFSMFFTFPVSRG